MKTIFKYLFPLGLLVGGYFILTAKKLQGLIIKLSNVSNLTLTSISFDIAITNPNAKAVTFNQFYGQVLINNTPAASINKKENIVLPGKNATTTLKNITGKFDAGDVITLALNSYGANGITITVQGTLVAEGLKFPINQSSTIKS